MMPAASMSSQRTYSCTENRIESAPMKRCLLLFLFATTIFAADKPMAIKAARLIDGRGGAVVSPAVIVVRGNRIESVGGAIPSDAQIIDLGDMTLLPGLIDAHTHVDQAGKQGHIAEIDDLG